MMNLKSVKTMQERPIKSTKTITDFYSAKEIEEKYQISYSRLYVIAKKTTFLQLLFQERGCSVWNILTAISGSWDIRKLKK